jgi:Mrp family chromosome partitioning ATPase/capsular polysaccharide biosynthesis protein
VHDRSLNEYLHVLRRRIWIVLLAAAIATLAAVLFAERRDPRYAASSDVLLRSQTLPSTLSGIADPNSPLYWVDPARIMSTQVEIARLPLMANRVVRAAHPPGMTADAFLGSSSVAPVPDTDFLRFEVTSGDPTLATKLANEYSRQYTLYRNELDTHSVKEALQTLKSRIATLQADGSRSSRANANELQTKADQLETLAALQNENAVVVRRAESAGATGSSPLRIGALGLALGLVLGLGLALLREAADTRLRSPEQIGAILHVPLLARLPDPGRRLRRHDRLAMLEQPNSASAEAFRILRTNLEFTTLGREGRAIMITSALEGEGKSTTAANLAVALARAGRRVVLADLDLRRAGAARFFDIDGGPGLTNVVVGHTSLDEALVRISLGATAADRSGASSTNGSRNGNPLPTAEGALAVLPAGQLPPNPGEFVGSEVVRALVAELRDRADFVIVDAPPVLHVGDPMTIARFVDSIVLVINTDIARRPVISELAHVTSRSPAECLGFVVCGGTAASYEYYGYSSPATTRAEAAGHELIR